jgi:hypothetical protein
MKLGTPFDSSYKAFDEVTLQKLWIGAAQSVSEELLLLSPDIRVIQDELMRALRVYVKGYVWADPPTQVTVSYPSDWWEAFKDRWFPKWYLNRWPARLTVKVLEGRHIYPKLKTEVPEHSPHLRLCVLDHTPPRFENPITVRDLVSEIKKAIKRGTK